MKLRIVFYNGFRFQFDRNINVLNSFKVVHLTFDLQTQSSAFNPSSGVNPAGVLGSGPHQLFPLPGSAYWLTRLNVP